MKKPNILFILIDDMGWRDLTCYGSDFYETPNIDRLKSEGMLFTDAYASCPVCSPTRASILSGKYPANVGVTNWINHRNPASGHRGRLIDAPYVDHLPLEEKCLAGALRENGYSTWHAGKWHIGGEDYYPEKHGFDINIGGGYNGSPARSGYFSPWEDIPTLKDADVPEGIYLTDYLTDRAVDLIRNQSEEKPFFLNMWYYSVHVPIQAKEEKIRKYEEKAKRMGLDKQKALEEGERFPVEKKQDKRVIRRLIQSDPVYAAMIESLDENVGKLLDVLEEKGIAKDTAVFFTSDNGGLSTAEGSPTCNLPLAEGKGWMYEGGTREPLLVRWPGRVRENSQCIEPVTSPDYYPTILEIAGLPLLPEQHEDGVSILPLLEETGTPDREDIFWHYPHYGNQGGTPGSSIRSGNWKLIEFYEDGRLELYNLREDIGEKNNLAETKPDLAEELRKRLKSWRQRMNALYPRDNPEWKPLEDID
jgi:arylsulfatase A-like enzyme